MCKDNAVQGNTFKIGDKVRAFRTSYPTAFPAGTTGTIVEAPGDAEWVGVAEDGSVDGYGWCFYPDELELVS